MVETVQQREGVAGEIRTAARHTVVYGLGAVAMKALGFFMLPVYTHYLTPVDYGTLEILDLSMSLLGMFLNMGLTAALLRYYGAAASAEEKNTVVSTALLFVTVTGLLMFALAVSFVRPLSHFLFGPGTPSTYLLLSFSSFILGYIANLPRTYLRALEASGAFVILDTASILIILVLNIVFVAVLKIGVTGILLSALLVNVAWLAVSVWAARRVGIGFSFPVLKQMVGFGAPLVFSNVAMFVINFADRFFIKYFGSLEDVGVYAIGYKFGFLINFLLVQPFYGMWQARMYIVHEMPDHPKIYSQIFVLYSVVLAYAGLALSLLSPEIVHVMVDARFAPSQNVIPVIVLAYIGCGFGYYVQLGMYLTKHTTMIGKISAGAAVVNLGLNYFLIRSHGMMGAAWATLLSFAMIAITSYWYSQRILPLPLALLRVAAVIALAIAVYLAGRWCQPASVPAALLVKTACIVAFPVLLWRMRLLSPSELVTIGSMWDSLVGKTARRLIGWTPRKAVNL